MSLPAIPPFDPPDHPRGTSLADEGLYQQILAHTQGLLWSFDLSGRLLTVNRDAGNLLGQEVAGMPGRNVREFVAAEHAQRFDDHLAAVVADGVASGLITLRRADGSTVAVACRSFTIQADGVPCIISHGLDVTASNRAEEMNRRFGLALEAAPDLVAVASMSGDLLFLNRAGRAICGIPPDGELSGVSLAAFHPEAEMPAMLAALSSALQAGASAGETRLKTHEGVEHPAEFTIISPHDYGTRPDFVAYILRDVSERARYQEVLRRNGRRFRDVIDNVAEVLFETDTTGRWTFLNPSWRSITGFNISDALYRDSGGYLHPDDAPLHAAELQQLMAGVSPERTYAVRVSTRDGGWSWMEVHARRRIDADGACAGSIGSLRDVTRQRELADQLAAAHRAALDANDRLSEFVANVSHEIRTPLNGVIGLASALLDTTLESTQRDYAERLQSSAEALLSLVNGVLDLSRIESGEMTIETVPFSVRDVVERGLETAFGRGRRKGLDVRLTIDDALPARMVSDPGRLRQLLLNLVDNAIKFTATGRVAVHLTTSRLGRSPAMLAEITDTGIGIDPARQSAVFEKFKQADASVSGRFGGTGLGLAICRQLVTRLGGDIGVRSVAGQGSTFWFLLPLVPADSPAESRPPRARLARPARVLIVDDNATNQLVARLMLERIGCTVDIVSDGAEAVAAAMHVRYDVVLMDCQMPVMDGYEATARIREGGACAEVPIVAMTALAIRGDRERCLAAGMNEYLTKPLQPELLVETLNRMLTAIPAPGGTPLPSDPAAVAVPAGETAPVGSPAAALRGNTLAVVDLEAVTHMLGDAEVTRQLVERVLLDLPRYQAELVQAGSRGDWIQVARVAHVLGGCVSNLNAGRTSAAARQIEHAIKAGNLADVEGQLAVLASAAAELADVLGAWFRRSPRVGGAAA